MAAGAAEFRDAAHRKPALALANWLRQLP